MIEQSAPKKKTSIKLWAHVIFILILIGAGIYGYIWYRQAKTLSLEAQAVLDRAQKFDVLDGAVKAEQDRCEKLIAQKEGDFSSFEYCKKFIDWAYTLPISQ